MKQNTNVKVIFVEDKNTPVNLTITIGNAQPSHSIVYINSVLVHQDNNSFIYPLGTQSGLIDKEVVVVSTITDIPANPDRITATHSVDVVSENALSSFDDTVTPMELVIDSTRYMFFKK